MKKSSEACAMVGGDGPRSYFHNSSFQKLAIDIAMGLIKESIRDNLDFNNIYLSKPNTFRIADFGCSVGPNTFHAMECLIATVDEKYNLQLQNSPPLEFQLFFSDLTSNDFNTLFKSLPPQRRYFAAGVPGSFYTILFPKSTLHVGFTSYSLHWLSKVPEEIVDKNSPAWNKGSFYCSGNSKEVAKAYLGQFMDDMNAFLNARAEEIVDEGLLVISVPGRPNELLFSQICTGASHNVLATCISNAVESGLITEEEADSFNLPMYHATPKEWEEIIIQNGYFSIERMKQWQHPMTLEEASPGAEFFVRQLRAVLEGFFKKHFKNDGAVDKIFDDFAEKLAGNWSSLCKLSQQIELYIVLKRRQL